MTAAPAQDPSPGNSASNRQDTIPVDRLFTFHPPNATTLPKYKAVRIAETTCLQAICEAMEKSAETGEPVFAPITDATRAFAQVIADNCPNGANDTWAAIDAVRIARMAANEAAANITARPRMFAILTAKLLEARWLACAAIALEAA